MGYFFTLFYHMPTLVGTLEPCDPNPSQLLIVRSGGEPRLSPRTKLAEAPPGRQPNPSCLTADGNAGQVTF